MGNHDQPEATDVRVSATLEEVALGAFSWAAINAPTKFINLSVVTLVRGQEIETRIRVSSEAINDGQFLREYLSKQVLEGIRSVIYA